MHIKFGVFLSPVRRSKRYIIPLMVALRVGTDEGGIRVGLGDKNPSLKMPC